MNEEIRQITAIYDMVVEFFVNYSFQLLGAVLIIIIGVWLGGRVAALVRRVGERHNLDITLISFFSNTARVIVIAIMVIIALGKIGISIGPFVAALGAVSLGAGLALQSPLSNYGAGLNLILTRPFVIGDTISVQNVTGIVKDIRLAYTVLTNEDDVHITIPNKHIIGEVISNSQGNTLIELEVGISYHADPEHAINVVKQALNSLDIVNDDNPAVVGIDNFADSNITLAVRLWAPTEKHYQIRYQANGLVYSGLKNANIEIAFPQREVKLLS